ncbi:MAG: efflux RND transporter periplasmic adaptor subunit [Owenweeksia sp.]|nr:efflux RND transporter periplasmic adaptor subunit [Owenweeksia sp.]
MKRISPQRFEHFLELTGTVSSEENILISAEAGGQVEQIHVKEGDRVKKGQTLVSLESEALRNQLEEAQSVYDLAKTTYEKRKKLWDQSVGSEIQYLQAKNNFQTAKSRVAQIRSRFNHTVIKSPINGEVDNIAVNQGEFVGVGSPVARVVDLSNVEVEAELSEEYLANIKEGDSIRVHIPALGYRQKETVDFISQVINPANRSFTLKVDLDNANGLIKPNLLASLRISDYQNDSALTVPSSSIGKDLSGDFVFVMMRENGKPVARKRYISTGKSFGADTEITQGLKPGDEVITAGSSEVTEGETIAVEQP